MALNKYYPWLKRAKHFIEPIRLEGVFKKAPKLDHGTIKYLDKIALSKHRSPKLERSVINRAVRVLKEKGTFGGDATKIKKFVNDYIRALYAQENLIGRKDIGLLTVQKLRELEGNPTVKKAVKDLRYNSVKDFFRSNARDLVGGSRFYEVLKRHDILGEMGLPANKKRIGILHFGFGYPTEVLATAKYFSDRGITPEIVATELSDEKLDIARAWLKNQKDIKLISGKEEPGHHTFDIIIIRNPLFRDPRDHTYISRQQPLGTEYRQTMSDFQNQLKAGGVLLTTHGYDHESKYHYNNIRSIFGGLDTLKWYKNTDRGFHDLYVVIAKSKRPRKS